MVFPMKDQKKYSIKIFNLAKGQKYKGLKESNGWGGDR